MAMSWAIVTVRRSRITAACLGQLQALLDAIYSPLDIRKTVLTAIDCCREAGDLLA